jgi:hypothetical protein
MRTADRAGVPRNLLGRAQAPARGRNATLPRVCRWSREGCALGRAGTPAGGNTAPGPTHATLRMPVARRS